MIAILLLGVVLCLDQWTIVSGYGVGGSLAYASADILRVCGDGESLLHAMQYSLIKRQRVVKSDAVVPNDMDEVHSSCLSRC